MTTKEITWGVIEWTDEGETAYFDGYVADVWRDREGWRWTVKNTEEVGEWPELQDYGVGHRKLEAAKRKAEAALRRAARRNAGRRVVY